MKNSLKTTDGIEIKKGRKYWAINDINFYVKRIVCVDVNKVSDSRYNQFDNFKDENGLRYYRGDNIRGYIYSSLEKAKKRYLRILNARKKGFVEGINEIEEKIKGIKSENL